MSKIYIKKPDEIKFMQEIGAILAEIVDKVGGKIAPDISPKELEHFAIDLCRKYKVNTSCKGYKGYPSAICIGVNDNAVHNVPNKRRFKNGDIVTVDMVIDKNGWFVDHARTFIVGKTDDNGYLLVEATKMARDLAIKQAVVGNTIGDIGFTIESIVKEYGFNVLRDMIGHGIGRKMHEEPAVPCFGKKGHGVVLKEGMVFTIEPMVAEYKPDLETGKDGWSTRLKDGGRFAMFEHTIAVTKNGPLILTEKS